MLQGSGRRTPTDSDSFSLGFHIVLPKSVEWYHYKIHNPNDRRVPIAFVVRKDGEDSCGICSWFENTIFLTKKLGKQWQDKEIDFEMLFDTISHETLHWVAPRIGVPDFREFLDDNGEGYIRPQIIGLPNQRKIRKAYNRRIVSAKHERSFALHARRIRSQNKITLA